MAMWMNAKLYYVCMLEGVAVRKVKGCFGSMEEGH